MYDISLIKQRMNCVQYAQRMGLPIHKSGDRCVSPIRTSASNPSSFVVDDDFWYDFGSGTGGDVIEFCAHLAHDGDRGAAIRELATITGVGNSGSESTQEWLDYTNQLNARTAFYNSQLTEHDRRYLRSRGVSDADADRLKIGRVTDGALRGRLFLPYFSGADGYVCYYATRAMPDSTFPENKYMKQKKDDYCQHLPWGLQTLNRSSETLVIAEGFFDAVSFEIAGYPVLSAITGRFSRDQIPMVLSAARKFDRVFIVYDDDSATSNAGASFTLAMAELLTRNRIPFVVGTVPVPYHDISEYYAAGGDLSRIIATAQPGISYIASRFTDFSELEKFVYTVARHTKRTALDELHSDLRNSRKWNAEALKTLFKQATTAPPENMIADEITKSRQLIYVDGDAFYEYTNGVWKRQPDAAIKGYADRAYGEFSTAQRIDAICKLLKTRTLRAVTFNQQSVWNFVNGTLELDTGKFRDHSPHDYCSFQAEYPYNPDATHRVWDQFIDDVSSGDAKVAELLQFIPAYALMNHCKYEKIFALTGSGGNGKSRYLYILEGLFGAQNVTHITPIGLLDKFQRIRLKNSLINIAGEIKSNVGEAQELMKQISSGETVSACYKNQNYVDFGPRAKLVFACNGQLEADDTSDALTRRLVIVDFKTSFVDYPDPNNPYQRQKDVNILDKLTEELNSGGVFNWAYEGYKLLNAVGYFTETADQERLLHDFKRASSPVRVFWDDWCTDDLPSEIIYTQVYEDYKAWCGKNGVRLESSVKFHAELKNILGRGYETGIRSVRIDGNPRKQRFYRKV